MERYYTDDAAKLSKGTSLNVKVNGKYQLLIPVKSTPATKSAPEQVEKTNLTDETNTYVEGLQSADQKTYTFNYYRDNVIQLSKYVGKAYNFLERTPDNMGHEFVGTLSFNGSGNSVNEVGEGEITITVNSMRNDVITDVRDMMRPTAIITTPLNDVQVAIGEANKYELDLETSPNATVNASIPSDETSIATVSCTSNKLTITGVAAGYTMVTLEVSATNEATSYRTIAVEVVATVNGE